MKVFNSLQLINELVQITETNASVVLKKCKYLNESQMEWRPSHGSWNITEVLAHLNEYARYYHPIFSEKITSSKVQDFKETFVSSPLGRSAWRSMKLGRANNVKRKFKAPKSSNPSIDTAILTGNEKEVFIEEQQKLIAILNLSRNINLRRIKVPISISRLVRLRLGDALMFVVYHNERHIQQIINILIHPKFPKK